MLDQRYLPMSSARRFRAQNAETLAMIQATIAQIDQTAIRLAQVTLPLIILGGSNVQTVTWTKPMPSATYETYVSYESILGSGTVAVSAKTVNGCTVTTTASALIAAGARVLVIAWAVT